MGITSIARNLFAARWRQLERYNSAPEDLQRQVLERLIRRGQNTEYGRSHHFDNIRSYDDFVRTVPLNDYEALKHDIDRMRHGETDVLWPGRVKWYAKSSGTTNDKSKFIPVSPEGLKRIHYRGGTDAMAIYLRNNPQSRLFDGKGLILGGSHAPNYNLPGSLVGDLSAILIENITQQADGSAQRLRNQARPHSTRGHDEGRHQPVGSAIVDALCAATGHGAVG